ncbi:MAG: hypothetical protein V8Q84_12230 [Bilophila sp.]
MDQFDKTPNLTFLPPQSEAADVEADAEEGQRDGEGPNGGAAPDEELVRAFEAEMAKAGGTVRIPPEDGPSAPDAAPSADAIDERIEGIAAGVFDVTEHRSGRSRLRSLPRRKALHEPASSPDAEPPTEESTGHADDEEAEAPIPSEASLPPFLPLTAEAFPAQKEGVPVLPGVEEERITRLEEALSRLSKRVAALEQRVDEAGAQASGTDVSGAALSEAIEAVSQEKDPLLRDEMRALSPEGGAEEEASEAFSSALSEPLDHAAEAVPFSVVDEAAPIGGGPRSSWPCA